MNGLGIIQNTLKASFIFEVNSKQERYSLTAKSNPDYSARLSRIDSTTFSPIEKVNNDLWFGASKSKNTIYLKFRRYTSMRKMESLANDLLSFTNKQKSNNLIIDLRDNYGGDFLLV